MTPYLGWRDPRYNDPDFYPGTVTLEQALQDESLVDKYVWQHSGQFPYAYYGHNFYDQLGPGPGFTLNENVVRELFYEEKARRRKEKIMAICSILKQVYDKKVKGE